MTPVKEALTALADVLAKRPAEEILFDWFRSGRLVGELSVLIKRRHPEVQAEIDRVYQEHLAKLGKSSVTRQRKTIDCGEAASLRRQCSRVRAPVLHRASLSALPCPSLLGFTADAWRVGYLN